MLPPFFQSAIRNPLSAIPICRLGLATRGGGHLTVDDIHHAIDAGVNFLNWPGTPDALSQAVAGLGRRRKEVMVCVQFEARRADDAKRELESILRELGTEYVDVLTYYYVEGPNEWEEIIGSGGAHAFCLEAKRAGQVRLIGVTTHQRSLAATMAPSGLLDLLMIRYNAAHRGAEQDIFPVTEALGLPVVVYTCLRWGALLEKTPDEPPGLIPPRAPAWYRFALQSPAVTVALMAPDTRAELDEDLTVLEAAGPLTAEEYARLAEHGQRVRRHAGTFP
ncbi:hypothetical protein AYO44_04925 [Planctomycetaceae bacterium SCGC AG-212-F19]|nr:hypothetical protein AYO44_04925 [Planctomycetaceae bacterium SCGC AG-212-F19]